MFTQVDDNPISDPREETAAAVHQAMTRFPLVVEILTELEKATVPFPGDAEIHHGCRRALTSMLVELSHMEPAPAGGLSKQEEAAFKWLNARAAAQVIDADQLERFQHFVDRILDPRNRHH